MFSSFVSINADDSNSYSSLLDDLNNGKVESLILIPSRREVVVNLKSGETRIVPILRNDQNILRTAESTGTQLEVKDTRSEESAAAISASFTLGLIFFIFCAILFRKSIKIANKSLSFLGGQSSFIDSSDIDTRFDDIAGISEAVDEVKEIVSFIRKPENYKKLGASIPKGFLLTGPPGTGKTLLAKALAGEAGVPFISTSASEFVELFIGMGASRIRNLFNQAKIRAPSIIFIDELDSIGRKRGFGVGGGNDEREQTLNQLLIEMDGFSRNSGVIVMGATNRKESLDPALIRPGRFDRNINFSLPDRKERGDILSIHARTKPLCDSVLLNEWAIRTPGFSGADLANLLNEAAIITARDNKDRIGSNQLERSLDRITFGLKEAPIRNINHLRIIAYHEIGKALVAYLTPGTDDIDKISILRRSGNLSGNTRFTYINNDNEKGYSSRKYLQNKLIVSLGGRAAELLVYGESEVTQISSNQLKEATFIAKQMVTMYGFSNFRSFLFDSDKLNKNIANDLLRSKSIYSNKTKKIIDKEILLLMNSAQERAKVIIKPYLHILDSMATLLLEEENISKDRFESILLMLSN